MNNWQKGVLGNRIEEDEKILKRLKKQYAQAEKEIDDKIAQLLGRTDTENLQSIIYQVEYQKALKSQISGILDSLNSNQFDNISKYLTQCYENGFIGVMYDLHGQGIPLIFPIDQEQVVRSLKNNMKLSKGLWGSLYDRNSALQSRVRAAMSRGVAQGQSYAQIAQSVSSEMGIGFNGVSRIVRTESHRIANEASIDAQYKAKDAGADIVKQWDSTLDKRTRSSHRMLDGQIREMDEPFEINGHTAMYPGGFGIAAEDINCRCAILQRARAALDEDELETLKERAKAFGLDKNDGFEDFKKKYIEAAKVIKYPFKGKSNYHLNPQGDLVEGEDNYHTAYTLEDITSDQIATSEQFAKMKPSEKAKINFVQNPDGTLTPLDSIDQYMTKSGLDIKNEVLTMNEDGTFSFGPQKYQAQYKADIPNNKVLTVDLSNLSKDQLDYFNTFGDSNLAKGQIIFDELPDDLQQKVEKELFNNSNSTFDDALKKVLSGEGYKGFYVINSNTKYQDLIEDYLDVLDDNLITKTKKSKLETLGESLAKEQKKLAKIDNKTYSGIWKDDVSVSDYTLKKASIQAKKDWYLQQIASGSADSAKFQKYLDDLDEFEMLGKQYETVQKQIAKIQANITKLKPQSGITDGDAFTQARKDAAYWFTDKNGSTKGADAVLRDKSGEVWRNATSAEREAIYGYTSSYSKINEPLRGIEYGTNKYLGVGNVDLNQIGVSYAGFKPGEVKKQIDQMTDIIERSSYDFDIWVNRGCRLSGMDKFFGIDPNDFYLSEKDLAAKLLGTTPTEYGFMSTGVAKGKGFGGGIKLNIYCPKGTKMMCAEPFSAFGNGSGKGWDGITKQSSFGSEAEMILQRGTQFRVTKVEKSNGTWYIDMDVIGQSH